MQMQTASNHLLIQTQFGQLRGVTEQDALCWLGIPYAAPPVGALRWHSPQDPASWEGVRDADQYGPVSVQLCDGQVIGSEDCLYLNVFRPLHEGKNLPVFFFIHGGNNQTDSGQLMNGPLMAKALDAVVVTINLRLNALGWLNIPAIKTGDPLEDSGNFGLLDIRKALDWVQHNIAAFGGDAENITVCGYSSGARDLLCMLISPLFRNCFCRVITFSGGFTVTEPKQGAEISTRALAALVLQDGKAEDEAAAIAWLNSATDEVRDYLMALPAQRFGNLMSGAAIRMSVFPHLFADGVTIPADGFAALARGEVTQVPMLVLSGGGEFTLPANNDPLFKDADFTDPEVIEEYHFTTHYGNILFGYVNAEQTAEAFTALPGQPPVYAARCLWGMNPAITGTIGSLRMGGTHGLDLFIMMGCEREIYAVTEEVFTERNRPGRDALADTYRKALYHFIRTGNPNGEGVPDWKPWDNAEGGAKILCLDADEEKVKGRMSNFSTKEKLVFDELAADESISFDRRDILVRQVLNGRFFSAGLDAFWEAYTANL